MNTPLPVGNDSLKKIYKNHFGLSFGKIEFIPKGEMAYLYLCTDISTGKKWVARIQKYRPNLVDTLVLDKLYMQSYDWLPERRLTIDGQPWLRKGRFYYSVSEFINPGDGSDAFYIDDIHLPELGRVLSQLHKTAIKPSLRYRLKRRDDTLSRTKRFRALLQRIERSRRQDLSEVRHMIVGHKAALKSLVTKLEKQRKTIHKHNKNHVLLHGDVHAYNILRPSTNQLYLTDFETFKFGHIENDLMYFDDRQLELLSQGYGKDLAASRAEIEHYRDYLSVRALMHFGEKMFSADKKTRSFGKKSFIETLNLYLDRLQ